VFDGDNYSKDWHKEAEKRGLPHLRSNRRGHSGVALQEGPGCSRSTVSSTIAN
jgi:hypothetical protein